MSNKVKEIFLVFMGGIVLMLHIVNIYGHIDYSQWLYISADALSAQYDQVKKYMPCFYLATVLVVFVKMLHVNCGTGKNKVKGIPASTRQRFSADVGFENVPIMPVNSNTDKHRQIRERHRREMARQKQLVIETVIEYVEQTMAPFMKMDDIAILCKNIQDWEASRQATLAPTIANGQLSTLDLRHLAWNIGERFKWLGDHRAVFIKKTFPNEFRDLEIKSIRHNLRQQGNCIIAIDIPEKGSCMFRNHRKSGN